MYMRRLIALDNLKKTVPPIDEDQKLAFLHAPFTGTTLFGIELAKLQEANTKWASALTVFHTLAVPLSLIPPVLIQVGARVTSIIQTGEGFILEKTVSVPRQPLLLSLDRPKKAKLP